MYFCTGPEWQYCNPAVTSPLKCVPADNMNNVKSIAMSLGLCCKFYGYLLLAYYSSLLILPRDGECKAAYQGWGGQGFWYPGNNSLDDAFREGVGSYQCLNSTTECPPTGGETQAQTTGVFYTGSFSH